MIGDDYILQLNLSKPTFSVKMSSVLPKISTTKSTILPSPGDGSIEAKDPSYSPPLSPLHLDAVAPTVGTRGTESDRSAQGENKSDTVPQISSTDTFGKNKVAILLAFNYQYLLEKNYYLPGMTIDLYLAYIHALKMGCSRLIVFTDNLRPKLDIQTLELIKNGEVDSDVTTYMEKLENSGQLHQFVDLRSYTNLIEGVARSSAVLFFYYSGHAEKGSALIPRYRHQASYRPSANPEYDRINLIDLIRPAVKLSHPDCRILSILDCCNSNGLNLPFFLNGEIFQLLRLSNWFLSRRIICLSAAVSGKSFSSHSGSKFSFNLFKILSNNDVVATNYAKLLMELQKVLVDPPELRSSYPDEHYIQPWTHSPSMLDLRYDYDLHLIMIHDLSK